MMTMTRNPPKKQKPARRKCCNTHGNGLLCDLGQSQRQGLVRKWWKQLREELKELYRQIFIPITENLEGSGGLL